jgi:hypothetical protein
MQAFHRPTVFFGTLSALALAASTLVYAAPAAVPDHPTFSKDVAPILQRSCQQCHRPGAMAPMSLLTYGDVRPWARAIKQKVEKREMPPWEIDPTIGIQKYKNNLSLSTGEMATLIKWIDDGAPEGIPSVKNSCAGSSLTFSSGSTAIERM